MTNIHPKDYAKLVSEQTPHSRHIVGCLRAFWVGGVICTIGQALTALAETLDLGEITAPMFTSMVLIFLGTTLTGVGVYDRIGITRAQARSFRSQDLPIPSPRPRWNSGAKA